MSKKRTDRGQINKLWVLRPLALGMLLGALFNIVLIISLTFVTFTIGSTLGFLLALLLFITSALIVMSIPSVWNGVVGESRTIMRAIIINLPARLFLLYVVTDALFIAGDRAWNDPLFLSFFVLLVYIVVNDVVALIVIFLRPDYFMPPREEIEASMKRMKVTGVKTVSDCPSCKNLVESDWHSCPNCGTVLPKFCVNCGTPVDENIKRCPKCGNEIQASQAIANLIETLRQTAELPASPETKSVRYEKYAEALIKGGRTDEAIEAYRTSIHYTQFYRKQTNFMTKMAMVYHNTGRDKQALDLLDASLELDPQDWAGARQLKNEILGAKAPTALKNNPPVKA
jgi:tetratricopeptide (TPR) repeat protein